MPLSPFRDQFVAHLLRKYLLNTISLFREQLIHLCEQDILSFHSRPALDKEVLWEKRHYLRYLSYICIHYPKPVMNFKQALFIEKKEFVLIW